MDVPRGSPDGFITTAELAAREDFAIDDLTISPATRQLRGPTGSIDVEPRVMQVLVVLADAGGRVVTRDTLFSRCWGGVYVGDDSLNRAVAALRRAFVAVGSEGEIETIPRTGYRLQTASNRSHPAEGSPAKWSRRQLAGAAAGLAVLGVIGGWSALESRSQRRLKTLLAAAEEQVRKETADDQTERNLREATTLDPGSAKAWGLLAYLRSTDTTSADPKVSEPARNEAEAAARRALAIDPEQSFALLAVFMLQGSTLDWAARDRRLREIIAIDPSNSLAIAELVLLTQAAGLNRESWTLNERALALEPFSIDYLCKRALKLWIAGRVPQADKVIDQVSALYPTHSWPWWVRFQILALTDRPRAASLMLDKESARLGDAATVSLWRKALPALEQKSAGLIAAAREACFNAVRQRGEFAVDSVMILSALGQADGAFHVAEGFLLSRGLLMPTGTVAWRTDLNDATWRINTQYLFTPPCAIMRADPRFLTLCEGIGLTDYWRARGVQPDYQLSRS